MDRPSRKTKAVNYCESKDLDDDEDFACVKAPPSKKAKEGVGQEQRRSSSKSFSQETNFQPMRSEKSRKPLDEKLNDRDLEAAITLSSLNNTDGLKDAPNSKADVKDENTDPASVHLSNCSVDVAVLGLDRITSERRSPASSGERKTKAVQDQDEDYEPKLTPDVESDDDDYSEPSESEEEEFRVKKVIRTKKEKVAKKDQTKPTPASKKQKQPSSSKSQASAISTPVRTPPSAKSAPKRPAPSTTASASKPALSPAGGRVPRWTPPAQIGKSPTLSQTPAGKSPGPSPGPSPGLRLGLSRLVRVKPLHPSVTSH
ncbi:RAD51-associated protein 1 [Nematolebias whitei]|uniref:RAD51-associated protein 1 n=1 Tax=Nematolebias whitei TaxID=451745 RepID=UPI001898E3DD|nr:RAD51-associated protein 1 [Nematolebias whitei]